MTKVRSGLDESLLELTGACHIDDEAYQDRDLAMAKWALTFFGSIFGALALALVALGGGACLSLL